jgi:hypothetical protein
MNTATLHPITTCPCLHCQGIRLRQGIALHEATHAVVGRALGLPVKWVSIDPGYDEEEGLEYGAAVKVTDEARQNQQHVLMATVAPSFIEGPDAEINRYAKLEAHYALERAGYLGYDPTRIKWRARGYAWTRRDEIEQLAKRLLDEGRVEFDG